MAWEDCVVDVHSVKISQQTLESMFSKCGSVRTVIHWKGQGEKLHVFMEYRSPSAAEAARAIGLDRSDLQVIKLSNNEMLKRKFRELEKMPENRPRSMSSYPDRGGLPAKPAAYSEQRDVEERHRTFDSERSRTRHGQSVPATSSFSGSRSEPSQADPFRSPSFDRLKDLASPLDPTKADGSDLRRTRHQVSPHDYGSAKLEVIPRNPPSGPSGEKSTGFKSTPGAVIEIPHAGELIRFDLDKQLEPNPAGIISMLRTVKADQKLWMMTAAHYNGKNNLDAARNVLEAGIDMAAQIGVETDTKPFWHLLSQINATMNTESSIWPAAASLSPTTSTSTLIGDIFSQRISESRPDNSAKSVGFSPSANDINLADVSTDLGHISSYSKQISSGAAESDTTATPMKTDPLSHLSSSALPPQFSRPTGSRNRDSHPNHCSAPPVTPSGPMGASARLHSLQTEIGALRENQAAVLEDLSSTRAAKRRAEDEVKEERSIRRKLEKHLRAAEDALARSKRMEDAALDQVKREVEARRKAEELLTVAKAEKDKAAGSSLFTHSSTNDAAMLLQLASMIRGVPSSDHPWQFGMGAVGTGVASSTAGSQPDN